MSQIEEKIKALGLELPPAPSALGIYYPVVITDKILYHKTTGWANMTRSTPSTRSSAQ